MSVLCKHCAKGDIGMCGRCGDDVCPNEECITERATFFCDVCKDYWCNSCLQNCRYCQYCDVDHCPRCDRVQECRLCKDESTENIYACLLCCEKHRWTRLGYGWICDDNAHEHDENESLPKRLKRELLGPIYSLLPEHCFPSSMPSFLN
jgi:hypothetical protein